MIERAQVDGKPATIAYIGENFEPADKDTALYVKVIFDDGTAMFGRNEPVVPPVEKDYDESKHPRDEHGRWTSGGGSDAESHHGNAERLPKIKPDLLKIADANWQDDFEANFEAFPNSNPSNTHVVGAYTRGYNCAGWAMGDTTRWWWPGEMGFWPEGMKVTDNSVAAFDELFNDYTAAVELPHKFWNTMHDGFVNIALYADDDGVPVHLARQSDDGTWISKAGGEALIEHDDLENLEGGLYGHVVKVWSVPLDDWRKLKDME